jgi:hypothetical protein
MAVHRPPIGQSGMTMAPLSHRGGSAWAGADITVVAVTSAPTQTMGQRGIP